MLICNAHEFKYKVSHEIVEDHEEMTCKGDGLGGTV